MDAKHKNTRYEHVLTIEDEQFKRITHKRRKSRFFSPSRHSCVEDNGDTVWGGSNQESNRSGKISKMYRERAKQSELGTPISKPRRHALFCSSIALMEIRAQIVSKNILEIVRCILAHLLPISITVSAKPD